jgi:Cu/Zn superoxide dismutase
MHRPATSAPLPLRGVLAAVLAALVAALLPGPAAQAQVPPLGVAATLEDADGQPVGTVRVLRGVEADEALVDIALAGLPSDGGFHAVRLSDQSSCDPDADDGPFTEDGAESRSLAVVLASEDGDVRQQQRDDALEPLALLGQAVLVHALPDNHGNIPDRYASGAEGAPATGPDDETLATGDAGPAVACGRFAPPGTAPADLPAGETSARAPIVAPTGARIGTVTMTEIEEGVLVEAEVAGLTPGRHGFHLHRLPSCTDEAGRPDFTAAEGHWDPDGDHHGAHRGDLPVLVAGEDGRAVLRVVDPRPADLEALADHAVMLHAAADNYGNVPDRYASSAEGAPASGPDAMTLATGDAGGRVGCGLLDGLVVRLAGPNRLATASAVARASFADGTAPAAVLARADRAMDALTGAPLAAALGGPLLLSASDELSAAARAELERVLAEDATVYLLGGEAALSAEVEQAVEELGVEVERIFGRDRFETAVAIARELGDPDEVLLVSGARFPDVLSAGAAGASAGAAILLSLDDLRHPATDAYLEERGDDVRLVAVGGAAARAYDEAEPLVGRNRIETAIRVAEAYFGDEPTVVGIARQGGDGYELDTTFADALTGGPHIGVLGGPMLLTPSDAVVEPVQEYLRERSASLELAYLYGGTSALAAAHRAVVEDAIRDRP